MEGGIIITSFLKLSNHWPNIDYYIYMKPYTNLMINKNHKPKAYRYIRNKEKGIQT